MAYNRDYRFHEPEWDPAYDSTWDSDTEEDTSRTVTTSYQHNRQSRAARDMQKYRHGYPDNSPKTNLEFYQNKIPFEPNGEYIDFIHEHWRYQYDTLESNHNFIQWLFPLRERGVNWHAVPLTLSEIEMMKKDKTVMERILKSYRLMLGFYGIVLVDVDTGMVARAGHNWEERFDNLNCHTHNNLRITRILKCLGEMGYEKLQAPLVRFFLEETLCKGELPRVKESALEYFMFAVKDKKERQKLVHFAWINYKPQKQFKWGPVDKLRTFNPLPQDAESKREIDVPEETPMIDSCEGYTDVGSDVSGRKLEGRRGGMVRKFLGPLVVFFRFVFSSFLFIFRLIFRPFGFLRGWIFWCRGSVINEDGLNGGQINGKTEGTSTGKIKEANIANVHTSEEYNDGSVIKSGNKKIKKDHKSHKQDGIRDAGMEEAEKKAKLEKEVSGRKYESVVEDDKISGDSNMNIAKPSWVENNYTELGAKESSEDKDDSDKHTENSRADTHSWGQTNNVVQQLGDSNRSPSTMRTKHNDALTFGTTIGTKMSKHIGTQNIFPDTDKADQEDDEKTLGVECISNMEDVLPAGETALKANINLMKGDGNPPTLGSKDNDESNSGTQNLLPDTDKAKQVDQDDEKADDRCVSNKELCPPFSREGEATVTAEMGLINDNKKPLTMNLKDTNESNTETQSTVPDTDKAEQDETNDGKAEDGCVSNTEPVPALSGEEDFENTKICKMEDNGEPWVVVSKDDDESNTHERYKETDKERTSKVEPDPVFCVEECDANHAEINKIGGNGKSLDSDGRNTLTQSTWSVTDKPDKVEKDKEKTEDEGVSNMKPVHTFNREVCFSENAEISKDNDGLKIGAQNTLSESDKLKQVQGDGTREAEEADNDGLNIQMQNTLSESHKPKLIQGDGTREAEEADNDELNIQMQNTLSESHKPKLVQGDGTREAEEADNDELNIQTQSTLSESDKLKQVQGDETREAEEAEEADNDGLNIQMQKTLSESDKPTQVQDVGTREAEEADNNRLNIQTQNTLSESDQPKQVQDDGTRESEKADNNGLNIQTQNTLSESDQPKQVQDDGTREAEEADNDGLNIQTQNTLSESDQPKQVQDDGTREAEKADNNGLNIQTQITLSESDQPKHIQDDGTREAEEADNDGLNIQTQNTLSESEKAEKVQIDDGITEDEETANVGQLLQNNGERDEDDNSGISNREGNRNIRTIDNDGENIRIQTTEPDKGKAEQDKGADHTRADV